MRVAALYDIHGNLPALEAVLAEVEAASLDLVVVGGDVGPGPMVDAVLDRLAAFGDRARYVMGNGDRELVSAFDREGYGRDTPWALTAWCAERLTPEHRDMLAGFEPVVSVDAVQFCHGSPRSDTEIITAVSPEAHLAPCSRASTTTSTSAATPTTSSTEVMLHQSLYEPVGAAWVARHFASLATD